MFIFRFITNQLVVLTVAGSVLAFFYPEVFLPLNSVFIWFFAATMFALGVVLEPQELKETARRPKEVALGVMTQFTVMPILGFLAAYFGDVPPAIALGFVIVGCAPGAMASNVMVFLAGGAVAFSITLTTFATLLAPLLTPSLVKFFGDAFFPISFWAMMKIIIQVLLIPLLLGMLLRRYLGKQLEAAKVIAPAIAAVAIVIICSLAVAKNQQTLGAMGMKMFFLVASVNILGYAAGWYLGKLYGFDYRYRLTLAIEIGMQNAGLGVVLALKLFQDTPEVAMPAALFAVWCVFTAALVTAYLRRRQGAQSVPI